MDRKEDFLRKLLATFKIEAHEHLSTMSTCLIELEKTPSGAPQSSATEKVLRAAHSLKGAARAVSLMEVEAVCQALESIFTAMKRREIEQAPSLFDTLHHALDSLGVFLSGFPQETKDQSHIRKLPSTLRDALDRALLREPAISPPAFGDAPPVLPSLSAPSIPEPRLAGERVAPPKEAQFHPVVEGKAERSQTIRIPVAKLDALLLQSEELLSAKLAAAQRVAELHKIHTAFTLWEREWTGTSSDVRRLLSVSEKSGGNGVGRLHTKLSKLGEMLERNGAFLKAQESRLMTLTKAADDDQRAFSTMLDHLLGDMKEMLMLPCSSLLEIFPKIVRELSRDKGKEVDLVVRSGEIEIDRRVLEEIKDPLIHIVRNCIDHGIEEPGERTRKSKPQRGTISIAVSPRDGNRVEIAVGDDGAGIDAQKVWDAASKAGIVSSEQEATMSEQEKLLLIFESGVSTSSAVTDISGRGLGLAIVREKVESLGGAISLVTRSDAGVTLRMVLPLTLATFQGIFVRVQEHLFVLPTTHVERAMRVERADIATVENRKAIRMNGRVVPLVSLADTLEMRPRSAPVAPASRAQVVVLGSSGKSIAFEVDEICYEQEVLVKSLGSQLSRVRNVAGATVLGTGKVVPILNVPDLMKSAHRAASRQAETGIAPGVERTEKKSVLIAEDSITARVLLRSILESAGYQVKTAVDGLDALTQLRTEGFDLVVSDVDMPRMNGFELTARIRAEKRLADLPVVLVTALESREDREYGAEVGANAYMNKSGFDQGDLLEMIRRLI